MSIPKFDIAVIGGGIIGMSTAMALTERVRGSLVVLEAEADLATHQSGRNSGVIHSGLYYLPGSDKARACTAGREQLYRFEGQPGGDGGGEDTAGAVGVLGVDAVGSKLVDSPVGPQNVNGTQRWFSFVGSVGRVRGIARATARGSLGFRRGRGLI